MIIRCLDIETTGLDATKEAIVEIASVDMRRDGSIVSTAETLVQPGIPVSPAGRPMAFTIGRFHTDPKEHALTKVAGEMELSLDVRAFDKAHLADLEDAVQHLAKDIGHRRGVRFDLGACASADVPPSHREVVAKLTQSAKLLGIPTMPLASPASHDHRHPHSCRRAVRHAVRTQRQWQSQPA